MVEIFDENNLMEQTMLEFSKEVAKKAIAILGLPCPVDVSLSIVTEEEIRQLNAEQRQIDKVTDVLSFPMLYFSEPMEEEAFHQSEITAVDPETGNLFLGDVVLCFERAKEQAEEYGHSVEREVAFLIVHSLLHLVGYDHMEEEEEKEMFSRQDEILNELKITR